MLNGIIRRSAASTSVANCASTARRRDAAPVLADPKSRQLEMDARGFGDLLLVVGDCKWARPTKTVTTSRSRGRPPSGARSDRGRCRGGPAGARSRPRPIPRAARPRLSCGRSPRRSPPPRRSASRTLWIRAKRRRPVPLHRCGAEQLRAKLGPKPKYGVRP